MEKIILGAVIAGIGFFGVRWLGENFNIPFLGDIFRKSNGPNDRDRGRRIKTIRDNLDRSREQNNKLGKRIGLDIERAKDNKKLAGAAKKKIGNALGFVRKLLDRGTKGQK